MDGYFFTPRAELDLAEIVDYLGPMSGAAEKPEMAVQSRCRQLVSFPEFGQNRDELEPGLRCVMAGKYLIYYKLGLDQVQIVRILHGSRDVDSIFRDSGD